MTVKTLVARQQVSNRHQWTSWEARRTVRSGVFYVVRSEAISLYRPRSVQLVHLYVLGICFPAMGVVYRDIIAQRVYMVQYYECKSTRSVNGSK
jgi:hypothetical protein